MAIKIIKPGRELKDKRSPIRFECPRCGCIFEVDPDEVGAYRRIWDFPEYFAACPNCNILCYSAGDKK